MSCIHVTTTITDEIDFSGDNQGSPIYFDREDVKKAVHAPLNQTWYECTDTNVFPEGDASLPPAFTVLPDVIEKSNRSVIIHGLGDYILIAEGARVVFQK
jgi:carboxypeptidase D